MTNLRGNDKLSWEFKGVKILQAIFIFILSLISSQAYGEVCLPLKKSSVTLDGVSNFDNIKISPSGSHLLYKQDSNVILFDMKEKEKTEFSNYDLFDSFFEHTIEAYGFSRTGSIVWALFPKNQMKVKRFIKNTTSIFSFLPEEERLMHQIMSEDRSKLINLSLSKDSIEGISKLEEEKNNLSGERLKQKEEELMKKLSVNINVLDMESFEQVSASVPHQILSSCSGLEGMTLFVVREDGSLYEGALDNVDQAPLELFSPIEGVRIVTFWEEEAGEGLANCTFLNQNTNVIKDNEKEQYILRRIKEREQYIIKEKLPGLRLRDMFDIFYYPFLVNSVVVNGERRTWTYHIPTGQKKILPEHYMHIGKGGQFAIELVEREGESYIKAVQNPFKPSEKRVLMELALSEAIHITLNEDKSLAFIGTVFGDFFILNGETGHIKRHFFAEPFRGFKISDSGNTFLLESIKNDRVPVEWQYKVHQIQEKCVQPVSSFAGNLESQLQKWALEENPTKDSLLAVLTGILQEEEMAQKYVRLIQPLLWRIFLHSPLLYLELHFRYPSLKFFPPFSASLIEDEQTRSQARIALISLLDSQSQLRNTKLFHWNFIHMLQPALSLLEDKEQDFYIEKITVSLSNGATKSRVLFQDVFQSKIFYVIYSRVKSWFGKDYEPVSDITVVRKKHGFQTVILSSESIQNQNSIETDFGVHYAVVENFSRELALNEIKAGQEIVNGFIEWSLLKGADYRAQVQIHVQDSYLLKPVNKYGPDYESVWQDQKMTGLIVIGSSLRSFSKTLLENYLAYFENQGFQFSPLSIPDFQPFLKEKIGACELDYFLKESHSDGDERNVFRFDRWNSVLKGVRPIEEGREEVLYLAFPKPFHFGNRETLLFSNLELAELIKQRERRGCGEITYFNTSCWAHVKARYEISAVNSPLFLNIPSKTLSDTFLNQEGDAIRELLHAYRNQLNFNGFRSSLKKNKGYLSGKLNRYIFPDEREYYNSIFEPIKIPLNIQIDLERKRAGEWMMAISPDEAL